MATTLSKERLGEIAILAWKHRLMTEGIEIHPKETKRELKNWAEALGISVSEAAEFWIQGLQFVCDKQTSVLESLRDEGKVGKQ